MSPSIVLLPIRLGVCGVGQPNIQSLGDYAGDMAAPIDDYALLSDMRTAVLVSRSGGLAWLCLQHIDSPGVRS